MSGHAQGPAGRHAPAEGQRPGPPREAGIRPGVKPLLPGMRRLLYVAAVLVLLAGFQLTVFTGRTASYFAWTISNPLAAAFLGAGYWASVSFELMAARQRAWANARIAVPAVLVFTILTLAATLAHLGLFHLGGQFAISTQIVTWGWIAIYSLVPALMLIISAAQLAAPGGDPPRSAMFPGWVYGLLAAQAAVLLSLGALLFAAPGQAAPWWPWKLTPLLAQATGAWLIGLGVAAAHALRERDARRLRPAAAAYVLLAVLQFIALARYPGRFEWSSAAGAGYLVFLISMLATGAAGLARGLPGGRPWPAAADGRAMRDSAGEFERGDEGVAEHGEPRAARRGEREPRADGS